MDNPNQTALLLNLLDRPAFGVRDGIIAVLNEDAAQRGLEAGNSMDTLLHTGKEEYSSFADGLLHLQLNIHSAFVNATVVKLPEMDLFMLDPETDSKSLQALSLAALKLREPLASVMALKDSLVVDEPSANAKEKLGLLNRSLLHIQRLIGNMSDAPRYYNRRNCKLQTQNITFRFSEWIEKAKTLLSAANLTLSYEEPKADILAPVCTEYLERAVYNLISNAAGVSPAGSTISAKLYKSGNQAIFTIKDAGPGMPANLFNRYLREPSLSDGEKGLGLGMLYVQAAAAAHQGTVLVRNGENGGTEVTITLSLDLNTDANIRSDILLVDYSGEQDHALLELSGVLPAEMYQ